MLDVIAPLCAHGLNCECLQALRARAEGLDALVACLNILLDVTQPLRQEQQQQHNTVAGARNETLEALRNRLRDLIVQQQQQQPTDTSRFFSSGGPSEDGCAQGSTATPLTSSSAPWPCWAQWIDSLIKRQGAAQVLKEYSNISSQDLAALMKQFVMDACLPVYR